MNELIEKMYASTEEDSRGVLQELVYWIMDCLRTGDINSLNSFYQQLDETKLSLLLMGGAIRTGFAYHKHYPEWNKFRLRAIDEAKLHYPDKWKGAFMGLIDLKDYPTGSEGAFDRLIGIHPTIAR